jgi:hypothetical protein
MFFWRFVWNLIEGCTWLRKVYHRSPACLVSSDLLANKLYTRIWLHNGFHLQVMCWCRYWFWLCPIMYKIQAQGTCLVSQVVSRPLHLHWETILPEMLSFVEPCSNEKELYRRQDMLLSIRLKSKQMSASLSSLQTANRYISFLSLAFRCLLLVHSVSVFKGVWTSASPIWLTVGYWCPVAEPWFSRLLTCVLVVSFEQSKFTGRWNYTSWDKSNTRLGK